MTDEITKEIFDYLVDLGALEIGEQEGEYLRSELNGQLRAIHELEGIAIDDDIRTTSHGIPYSRVIRAPLREDRIEPCKESDEILAQAADVFERYIVVPDIPSEELE
ncbi:MAG: aspartyl/glutamyl-tRNA amidotransferase subunit C [Chloroflexi bacterium]|nr:aspartyl/glutamyl-tRNA amidotransferase subunit C [Chloroflexota bacterium]